MDNLTHTPWARAKGGHLLPGGVKYWEGAPQPTFKEAQDLRDAYLEGHLESVHSCGIESVIQTKTMPAKPTPESPAPNLRARGGVPVEYKGRKYRMFTAVTLVDEGTNEHIRWETVQLKPASIQVIQQAPGEGMLPSIAAFTSYLSGARYTDLEKELHSIQERIRATFERYHQHLEDGGTGPTSK